MVLLAGDLNIKEERERMGVEECQHGDLPPKPPPKDDTRA